MAPAFTPEVTVYNLQIPTWVTVMLGVLLALGVLAYILLRRKW